MRAEYGTIMPRGIFRETMTDRQETIAVDLIRPGRYQPRLQFDPDVIQELAASIASMGLIEPLVVMPTKEADQTYYELIAGERRWRAAQVAGLQELPCIVKNPNNQQAALMALVENIQREDLTPVEEALAMKRLVEDFAMTQQEVGQTVGKKQSTVSHLLRMLEMLDEDVLSMVQTKQLSTGHAKALMRIPTDAQIELADRVLMHHLSVRQLEKLCRQHLERTLDEAPVKPAADLNEDPDVRRLLNHLSEQLGYRVTIERNKEGQGTVALHFSSTDELEGIFEKLDPNREPDW